MNPQFFGDSYDIVKRFFCRELSTLGYSVVTDAMLTGDWKGVEHDFYRFIGVEPRQDQRLSPKSALFLDPDTGVKHKTGKQHVSFERLAKEAMSFDLVFSFDQSFSRQVEPVTSMREKIALLHALGCHAMYYNSHARFLFVATESHPLKELRMHLISLGLPESRLLGATP